MAKLTMANITDDQMELLLSAAHAARTTWLAERPLTIAAQTRFRTAMERLAAVLDSGTEELPGLNPDDAEEAALNERANAAAKRVANRIDGYDRDDLGDSQDF